MAARQDFIDGAKTITPVLLGIAPFGLVSGVAAVNIGMTPVQAMGMSVLIYAGTSQLAAIDLIGQNTAAPIIVLTVFVVNARLVMYSASIAPHLRGLSEGWKSLLSYLLTDHVYALAIATFDGESQKVSTRWYLFGLGVTMWAVWQISTLLGIVLGATVPDHWGLDFVIPLTFLAIVMPELRQRRKAAVAVLSGGLAVAVRWLPMNLGLIVAAAIGVLVGAIIEEVRHR